MAQLQWGRYCLVCKEHYIEIDSIGKWQCSYHPLPLNRDCPNRYPQGCYDCCGTSPFPFLADGSRNPNFNSLKLKGCVAKDHSGIQLTFSETDDIPESAWPQNLLLEMSDDIQILKNSDNTFNQQKLRQIKHHFVQNQFGELFLRRFDKEEHDRIVKTKKNKPNPSSLEPFDVVEAEIKGKTTKAVVIRKEPKNMWRVKYNDAVRDLHGNINVESCEYVLAENLIKKHQ